MIFVMSGKKFDTDKMELISEKCKKTYKSSGLGIPMQAGDVKLWKSKKGSYVLTYSTGYYKYAELLSEEEAKNLLLQYNLTKYEELFGELEEG